MNRLQHLFGKKQSDILSVYFTAGYPTLDSVTPIINSLAEGGVDMVEIGIPFSDPMADGPVIQHSSSVALKNGMTLHRLLDDVAEARHTAPDMPFVLMGYLNPIYKYGAEALFARCREVGIDALIIPDLPFDEYMRLYKPLCDKYELPLIMLITPETSDGRIHLIDNNCDGFIYMVSAASVTGTRDSFGETQLQYFRHVNSLNLKHPRLIGFGVSNVTTMRQACEYSSGAIIGSLYIKCINECPDNPTAATQKLLTKIGR